MRKLLVAMQYYPGDLARAMSIARLIADIEPSHRKDVEFCFAGRFDVTHDRNTVNYVRSKFKVHVLTSNRRGIGWPDGPNDLWHELMVWSHCMIKDHLGDWEAVLTIEGDSVPLQRDWLNKLMAEWDRARSMSKFIVGCLIDQGQPDEHINGNSMWDCLLTAKIPSMVGTPCGRSWDVFHAKTYLKHSMNSPLYSSMHNVEKHTQVTEKVLYRPRLSGIIPAFFHGAKSPKAEAIVRRRLRL